VKRLLDEPTDDLTRDLLGAARAHRPGSDAKARLLLSLGVGGGVSLWSAKAHAWLTTSVAKATLGSAVLGSAVLGLAVGSAYVLSREDGEPRRSEAPPGNASSTEAPLATPDDHATPAAPSPSVAASPPEKLEPAAPARPAVRSTAPVGDARLLEEIRRVDEMRLSLRSGRRSQLRDQIARYRARFAAGRLSPEVDRLATAAAESPDPASDP
jgi:hypothetical protein